MKMIHRHRTKKPTNSKVSVSVRFFMAARKYFSSEGKNGFAVDTAKCRFTSTSGNLNLWNNYLFNTKHHLTYHKFTSPWMFPVSPIDREKTLTSPRNLFWGKVNNLSAEAERNPQAVRNPFQKRISPSLLPGICGPWDQ